MSPTTLTAPSRFSIHRGCRPHQGLGPHLHRVRRNFRERKFLVMAVAGIGDPGRADPQLNRMGKIAGQGCRNFESMRKMPTWSPCMCPTKQTRVLRKLRGAWSARPEQKLQRAPGREWRSYAGLLAADLCLSASDRLHERGGGRLDAIILSTPARFSRTPAGHAFA